MNRVPDHQSFPIVLATCIVGFGMLGIMFAAALVMHNIGVASIALPFICGACIPICVLPAFRVLREAKRKYRRLKKTQARKNARVIQ